MEDIDGGLHPAVDGQSLDEDEDEDCRIRTLALSSPEYHKAKILAIDSQALWQFDSPLEVGCSLPLSGTPSSN